MSPNTPEDRANRRTDEFLGLIWHVCSYVIIVPFLFLLDWYTNDKIEWAYWAAIPWAVGLLFHIVAYVITARLRDRTYERYLAQEKAKQKDKKA